MAEWWWEERREKNPQNTQRTGFQKELFHRGRVWEEGRGPRRHELPQGPELIKISWWTQDLSVSRGGDDLSDRRW